MSDRSTEGLLERALDRLEISSDRLSDVKLYNERINDLEKKNGKIVQWLVLLSGMTMIVEFFVFSGG